jgi:hypothetical protein
MKLFQFFDGVVEDNFFPLYQFARDLRIDYLNHKLKDYSGRSGIDLFNFSEASSSVQSDTLVILGSGSSINDISESGWEQLKSYDTFGFNFWLIHDFTPKFYMFEPPRDPDNLRLMAYWLKNRQNELVKNKSIVLVKDIESRSFLFDEFSSEFLELFRIVLKNTFHGTKVETVKRSILAKGVGGLRLEEGIYFNRASLFSAVYFGWRMGYKKIILAGIDLNSTGYFYEASEYSGVPTPNSGQSGTYHKTVNKDIRGVPVDKLIYLLQDCVLRPSGVELFTLNKGSLLYPEISHFDLR